MFRHRAVLRFQNHRMITLPVTARRRRKRGRKTVFTRATKARLIRAIGSGIPICHACNLVRISKAAFHDYRNRNASFDQAIETAVATSIETHLNLVIKAAKSGETENSRWLLARLWPQYFSTSRLEVSGIAGAPIAGAILTLQWPHQMQNQNEKVIAASDPVAEITSGAN